MKLSFRPLHPLFAAEVSPIDLRLAADSGTLEQIRAGMNEYAVLVFRDQAFADSEQLDFAQRFDQARDVGFVLIYAEADAQAVVAVVHDDVAAAELAVEAGGFVCAERQEAAAAFFVGDHQVDRAQACFHLTEFVEEGQTGWLFDPSDPKALADTLATARHAAPHTVRSLCQRARVLYQSEFTVDRMVSGYMREYARLA